MVDFSGEARDVTLHAVRITINKPRVQHVVVPVPTQEIECQAPVSHISQDLVAERMQMPGKILRGPSRDSPLHPDCTVDRHAGVGGIRQPRPVRGVRHRHVSQILEGTGRVHRRQEILSISARLSVELD